MLIDPTTLADLEVSRSRDGGPGILALVDTTRTGAGHRALRHRLESPHATVEEIRETQEALEALTEPGPIDHLGDDLLRRIESYLRSNVLTSRARPWWIRMEELWMRLRYPGLIRELENGQASLRELLGLLRRVIPTLTAECGPPLLQRLGRDLSACSSRLESALGSPPLLRSDRAVRDELRGEILEMIGILGELDALRAMAAAGESYGWTRPEVVDSPDFVLEAVDAYHPFVDDATPNPITLDGGESTVFLTGPNMAGKTTYLKTVGIVVLLAQAGMKVPAASARLAPVEVLFTSLNPADNLRDGISYFYAEVLRVREAAEILADGRKSLMLFDEVFKGTNVKDALDASAQVIRGFARSRRSGSIFASHLSELHETLGEEATVRFCRFDAEVVDGVPTFDYRLAPGVSEQRLGLLLLDEARVPELIERIGTTAS